MYSGSGIQSVTQQPCNIFVIVYFASLGKSCGYFAFSQLRLVEMITG